MTETEFVQSEILRASQPGDLDVGDLAVAIRALLDVAESPVSEAPILALLSSGNRASHVMGSGAAEPA